MMMAAAAAALLTTRLLWASLLVLLCAPLGTVALEWTEHTGHYCHEKSNTGLAPPWDDCGKQRSQPFPNKCWEYWSNTDTLDQCKQECIKRKCPCFGWLPTDTGYFHKCRMLSADIYDKPSKSSTGFTAYTSSGEFPLLTDPNQSWEGWVLVGAVLAYLGVGSAHGFLIRKQRGIGVIPNLQQWQELIGLAQDGAAFSRSLVGLRGGGGTARSAGGMRAPLAAAPSPRNKKDKRTEKSAGSKASSPKRKEKRASKEKKDTGDGKAAVAQGQEQEPDRGPGWEAREGALEELRDEKAHSSQQKIKVVLG